MECSVQAQQYTEAQGAGPGHGWLGNSKREQRPMELVSGRSEEPGLGWLNGQAHSDSRTLSGMGAGGLPGRMQPPRALGRVAPVHPRAAERQLSVLGHRCTMAH